MSYKIFTSSIFEKEIKTLKKKYPSINADLGNLVALLQNDPQTGTSVGKDCYKIRMGIGSKGKGKSGGARVITRVKIINNNIFLLSIYDKSEKETVGDKELTILLKASGL